MTRKLLVRQGGGTASEVDFLDFATPRKGSPWFDGDTPLFQMGQRFANGESAMGYFKIVDPAAALSTTGFRIRPWAEVRLTEDASGDELTLAWMRITANDASRRAPYTGGDQVEHDPQLMDCNLDLRGLPFQSGWHRDAENEGERLNALEAVKLNGASSTGDIHRVTTDITIASIADGHLCDMSDSFDLDTVNYPAGTEPTEIIADIAEQSGKTFGVVLHHTGGTTHKCLLYVDQDDLTTYTTDVRISDQLADFDPDDDTAPTFEPHWLMGAGREQNMEGVISGLVSIYGGIDGEERTVFVETGDDDDEWETWVGVFNDDQADTLTVAERHANWQLTDRKRPYQTHKVSILVRADQAHLVEAGMAIETKSVVMEPGPNKHAWIWRRVAEKTIEPAPDGRYWLHLHLERPRHTHGANGGGGQPRSTSPKPAPEFEPDPGDSEEAIFKANDPGGDTLAWDGILPNQGGSGDGANGTDWYYYKSNSPDVYSHTRAWTAGDQLRVSGYIGCRTSTTGHLSLVFTSLAPGTNGSSVTAPVILDGPHSLSPTQANHSHADEWTLFTAGPFTAPVGTTSYALGRIGGTIDFDEVSILLVGDPVANDVDAVDYGTCPHDSTHWLPSDYILCRLADLQTQIGASADASALDWYVVTDEAYGATGDGSTDDAAAVQAAIDAAEAAGGGIVYFPEGTYQIGTTLVIDSDNVALLGTGKPSIIRSTVGLAGSDVLQVTSDYVHLRDLQITAASQKSGGVGISFSTASYCSVERCWLQNQYHSIKISGGVVIRLADLDLRDQVKNGVWITGTGNDYYLSKIVADNSPVSTGSGLLIDCTSEGATWAEDCDFIHFSDGLKIAPASGTTRWHFFLGSAFDQSGNDGIHLGGAGGSVNGVTFNNCWSASSTNQGIFMGSGVTGVNFVGGRVINNGQHGIATSGSGPSHIVIADSLIATNSTSSSGTYDGINLSAGVQHITITGNQAFNGFGLGSTQGYGLAFQTGATDYVQVVGNDFSGNATGEIDNFAGISGTHNTYLPPLDNTATHYLDGTGAWTTPAGTSDHGALTGLTDDDHTQYLKETDVAAKGDIYAASANDTVGVLTVGSNDQVLTADSTQALGVKWATPSASSSVGVGEILIADTHSTPLVFGDLLQNEDEDNLLYADPT